MEQLKLQKELEKQKIMAAEEDKFFEMINTDDAEIKLSLKKPAKTAEFDSSQVDSWMSMLEAVRNP